MVFLPLVMTSKIWPCRVGADEGRLEVGDRDDGDVAFEGGAHLHDAVAVGGVAVAHGAVDLILGLTEGQDEGVDRVRLRLALRELQRLGREAREEGTPWRPCRTRTRG
jgi:hypothetical protein